MDTSLRTLVENVGSRSSEQQDEALAQLAMLLEKNTRPSNADLYESLLPPDLLRLNIDSDTQREILRAAINYVPDVPRVALQFFFAVGKAKERVALEVLDESISRHPKWVESPDVLYQAIIALDNCLTRDPGARLPPEVRRSLRAKTIVQLVETAQRSKEKEISVQGNRLAEKIKHIA